MIAQEAVKVLTSIKSKIMMQGSCEEVLEIEMDEMTSKTESNDLVMGSEKKSGNDSSDYSTRHSRNWKLRVNVDSSNLSSSLKIRRVRKDSVFGWRKSSRTKKSISVIRIVELNCVIDSVY